jgi:lipooligosaccharide transport system ATP-binding protein
VTKLFGSRAAVEKLDLEVPPGVCFGLLGPNGAGKTTTLRMIYGVALPTAGSVRVFGLEVRQNPRAVRSRLGVTLQENVQIESLSPVDNLRIFGRYHRIAEPRLSERVEALLDFLGLRSHAQIPVVALSGGFRRRLAIAMSLINEPELLILDEPTTGLDPAVRLALWSRVRELRAAGTSVLLTTHYMDEAERLCDRVAIMSGGRAVADGSPRELVARYVGPQAVELDCSPEEQARFLAGSDGRWQRLRAGNRLVIYAGEAGAVVRRIHEVDGGDRRPLIIRPSNLEDVFLAATGSELQEHA